MGIYSICNFVIFMEAAKKAVFTIATKTGVPCNFAGVHQKNPKPTKNIILAPQWEPAVAVAPSRSLPGREEEVASMRGAIKTVATPSSSHRWLAEGAAFCVAPTFLLTSIKGQGTWMAAPSGNQRWKRGCWGSSANQQGDLATKRPHKRCQVPQVVHKFYFPPVHFR